MRNLRLAVVFCLVIFAGAVFAGCGRRAASPGTGGTSGLTAVGESSGDEAAQKPESPPAQTGRQETEPAEPIQAPSMTAEEYPVVDGSTATLPLSQALYRLVTGASGEEAEAKVIHTKTTNAYRRLMEGNTYEDNGVALVLAYEPSRSVYEEMEASGIRLNIKPIGKDALVFMTNAGNPVKSLTEKQLVDIYSGRIKNWAQAGGENKEILAFQRPVDSGSQTLMEKLVMRGAPMEKAPSTTMASDMGELIDRVAAYNNRKNALGYSVYFYARSMYQSPGLRFMAVDGVSPSNETIRDQSYPYVNEFYAVIREDEPEDSAAHRLFDWLTTDDGQALIGELGYVSLKEPEREKGFTQEPEAVAGEAKLGLSQDERILLDGRKVYGTDGVMVLNGKLEVERKIEGVSLSDRVEMAEIQKPVILTDTGSGTKGLYHLAKNDWILKPGRYNLYEDSDGALRAFWPDGEKEYLIEPGEGGGTVSLKEVPGNRVGNHFWKEDLAAQTAQITDLDGTVVNTVNFRDFLEYEYGYAADACFLARDKKGKYVVFNETGEVVFTEEDLKAQWPGRFLSSAPEEGQIEYYPECVSRDGKWILIRLIGGGADETLIYSIPERRVVTGPGSRVNVALSDEESSYCVTTDGKTAVFDSDGRPIRSRDGGDFSFVMGDGYYARQDGSGLYVENRRQGTGFCLPVEKVNYACAIAGDTFYITDENQGYIYRKDACLMKGPETGWWEADGFVTACRNSEENVVLRKADGEILYRSTVPENLLRPFPKLLAVTRGNYFCLLDYRGRCALKLLAGDMTDD